MTVLVSELLARSDSALSDSGVRWPHAERIRWLNEAYQQIVALRPDAASKTDTLTLSSGSKQALPANAHRLIDVVRNLAGNQQAITLVSRAVLDATDRLWHMQPPTMDIEHFFFDDAEPRSFYVYPPAVAGATIEAVYATMPDYHTPTSASVGDDSVRMPDPFVPAVLDWMLYRAYQKDADIPASAAKSATHLNAFLLLLGEKSKADVVVSPNA